MGKMDFLFLKCRLGNFEFDEEVRADEISSFRQKGSVD